jgi:Holliday junction DNA helicase RuvA
LIAQLEGVVVEFDAAGALLLAVGQVTFEIHTPASLSGAWREGAEVRVYTHLLFSNERLALYGFKSAFERNLFRLLLTATQVGPRVALNILELGGAVVARAIASGDARTLTAASGVGHKKAERIVLDLRDRIGEITASAASEERFEKSATESSEVSEAIDALVMLGFPHHSAVRAVNAAKSESSGGVETAELIKIALRKVKTV